MSTAKGIPTADELQRHARWIRRLAGELLRDEGAAEDLVQEAWLAALTHPPADGRLRPWLRQVARNFARMRHRGNARRTQREREAQPPAAPEEPDADVLRLEAEQRLSRELAALDEPFRSVLMLRYYEDLEPAEIAARLALPGGTVRWRLMRAHALLRQRLDRAHGGARRAWVLAFAPLARVYGAAPTATVVLPGVVIMNLLKFSAATAAVVALAFGLSISGLLPDSLSIARRERPLEVSFRALEPALGDAPIATEAVQLAAEPEPERVALSTGGTPEPANAALSGTATIDARLVGGGKALSHARLVVAHDGARSEALSAGPNGRVACVFQLSEPRAFVRIELFAFGYASEERSAVCAQGETTHLGRIELEPGGAVSGRIVDERGIGLADCRVTLGSVEDQYRQLEDARLLPARDTIPTTTSEVDGRFRLMGVAAGMNRLWAHRAGRRAGYTPPFEVRAGQESTGVELALEPLAPENRLRGIVLDPDGKPVPRAKIAYRHAVNDGNSVSAGESSADQEGRFEFVLPANTRSSLRASDPAGRWDAGSLSDVVNGERELVLRLREAREVELVVLDRGHSPLVSFAVELRGVDASADLEGLVKEFGEERAAEFVAELAPRLGGLALAEHSGGRARIALPDEPFLLRVVAPAHRVSQIGPLDPARVGAMIECLLDPVPGLSGVVLRDGAPAPGVRVELRAAVEAGERVIADGERVRVHPAVLEEARTDSEGRFRLTARAAGSYFVRAEPGTGAPAEVGPVTLDGALDGPALELHLGTGGAIEGRVKLTGGTDPEGAIVGISRGDGAARTQRVASDGSFRFNSVIPGPWRVELRQAEVLGPARTIESVRAPDVEPFDLAANCTVYDGETAFVEVFDVAPEAFSFEGRLRIDGRAAVGWTAKLGPVRKLDIDGEGWSALDSDGRFMLRARAPGDYRLTLRRLSSELQEQFLFQDLTLQGGDAPWERELHTGKLLLVGLDAWDGEGSPTVLHYWKGPGELFGVAIPVGSGERTIEVPAGDAELCAPGESEDPQSWKVLRAITVQRGRELRVELSLSELEGR